jgi:hypothetical protein
MQVDRDLMIAAEEADLPTIKVKTKPSRFIVLEQLSTCSHGRDHLDRCLAHQNVYLASLVDEHSNRSWIDELKLSHGIRWENNSRGDILPFCSERRVQCLVHIFLLPRLESECPHLHASSIFSHTTHTYASLYWKFSELFLGRRKKA